MAHSCQLGHRFRYPTSTTVFIAKPCIGSKLPAILSNTLASWPWPIGDARTVVLQDPDPPRILTPKRNASGCGRAEMKPCYDLALAARGVLVGDGCGSYELCSKYYHLEDSLKLGTLNQGPMSPKQALWRELLPPSIPIIVGHLTCRRCQELGNRNKS